MCVPRLELLLKFAPPQTKGLATLDLLHCVVFWSKKLHSLNVKNKRLKKKVYKSFTAKAKSQKDQLLSELIFMFAPQVCEFG